MKIKAKPRETGRKFWHLELVAKPAVPRGRGDSPQLRGRGSSVSPLTSMVF